MESLTQSAHHRRVTALDLCPRHPSVWQCDFLQLHVLPRTKRAVREGKPGVGYREFFTAEFCCQRWWCAITGRQKNPLPTYVSSRFTYNLQNCLWLMPWKTSTSLPCLTMFDTIWLTSTKHDKPTFPASKANILLRNHVMFPPLRTQTARASSGEFSCVSFLHGIASLDSRTSTWEFAESLGASELFHFHFPKDPWDWYIYLYLPYKSTKCSYIYVPYMDCMGLERKEDWFLRVSRNGREAFCVFRRLYRRRLKQTLMDPRLKWSIIAHPLTNNQNGQVWPYRQNWTMQGLDSRTLYSFFGCFCCCFG